MDLKSKYKLWIFRIGLVSFCFTGIGLIIFFGWYSWEEDKFKKEKKNQVLKTKLEKFYYVWGWALLIMMLINLFLYI